MATSAASSAPPGKAAEAEDDECVAPRRHASSASDHTRPALLRRHRFKPEAALDDESTLQQEEALPQARRAGAGGVWPDSPESLTAAALCR